MSWNSFIRVHKIIWQVFCNYYMTISTVPKNIEKQLFKKKAIFPLTKVFGLFLLALSSVTNLRGQFVRVPKVFWQILWKLWERFCNTDEIVETTNFWKRGNFFSKKNWRTFRVSSSMISFRHHFVGVHKVFWHLIWE